MDDKKKVFSYENQNFHFSWSQPFICLELPEQLILSLTLENAQGEILHQEEKMNLFASSDPGAKQ